MQQKLKKKVSKSRKTLNTHFRLQYAVKKLRKAATVDLDEHQVGNNKTTLLNY